MDCSSLADTPYPLTLPPFACSSIRPGTLPYKFFSLVLKMGVLSEEINGLNITSNVELENDRTFDEAGLTVGLMFALLASVIVGSVLAVYQVYHSTRAAARAAAVEREASIARGRLSHPPTISWELREGNRYCVFLSHFKEEAGSNARYLSDLIKRKTGCASYLDSNDLVDLRTVHISHLRTLFNEGKLTHLSLHVPRAYTQPCTQHTTLKAFNRLLIDLC